MCMPTGGQVELTDVPTLHVGETPVWRFRKIGWRGKGSPPPDSRLVEYKHSHKTTIKQKGVSNRLRNHQVKLVRSLFVLNVPEPVPC